MLKGLKVVKKNGTSSLPPQQQQNDASKTTKGVINDSSSHSHESNQQIGTAASVVSTPTERESWMLAPPTGGLLQTSTSSDQSSKVVQQEENIAEARELNPYFANGGRGLPSNQQQAHNQKESTILSAKGSNWRQRALMRAQERASEQGGNVNDYLRENWGVTASEMQQSLQRESRSQEHRSSSKRRREETVDEKIRRTEHSVKHKRRMLAPDRESSTSDRKWGNETREKDTSTNSTRNISSSYQNHPSSSSASSSSSKFSQFSGKGTESRLEQVALTNTGSESITEDDLNKLAARAMKAKLMGNDSLHEQLTKELEEKKRIKSEKPSDSRAATSGTQNFAVLPKFDDKGRRIQKEMRTLTSQQELEDMVRETKENGVDDFNTEMLRKMGENTKYAKEWEDEYDETTSGMEKFGTRNESTKGLSGQRSYQKKQRYEQNQRNKQVREFNMQNSTTENCLFCFKQSKKFKKHLVISLGEKAFLTIPPFGSLVEGHCIITTFQHHTSTYDADEDEVYEIRKFKQSLKKMFAAQNKDVLFLETVTPHSLKKRKHAFIECIPIPTRIAQEAPGYFKKAIMEADAEYSDNAKLIDTRGKGITRSIPKDFPYFHVEFGINGGFAHIIEDETKFSYLLGREVVCGMLHKNANEAKLRGQSFEEEKRRVLQFVDSFKQFDWTVELDGGGY